MRLVLFRGGGGFDNRCSTLGPGCQSRDPNPEFLRLKLQAPTEKLEALLVLIGQLELVAPLLTMRSSRKMLGQGEASGKTLAEAEAGRRGGRVPVILVQEWGFQASLSSAKGAWDSQSRLSTA